MSRIDEALRLLHGRDHGAVTAAPAEPFVSPWDLDDALAVDSGLPRASTLVESRLEGGAVISGFNSKWKERLVVSDNADPFLIEQFRRLAATLHQAQASAQVRSLMITSAVPGDGKTLTSINLALTLSESYKRRVLLVDADLRRPSIRDVTRMPNVLGLADGLRVGSEQKLTVLQLTRHLSLLPAGRPDPDPMGGLTSTRMRRILEDACRQFDWVILDAPPVGTVADARILGDMADASLLVVRAGQTDCAMTKKAIESIGRERILGVVLNGLEGTDGAAYGYYYQPEPESRAAVRS